MQIYTPRRVNGRADADFTWAPGDGVEATLHGDGRMRVGWCSAARHFTSEAASSQADPRRDVGVFRVENATVFFLRSGWPLFLDRRRNEYLFSDKLGMRASFIKNTRETRALEDKSIELLVDTAGKRSNLSPAVVLESPGFKVWGHWVVDQYPRLYLLDRLGLISQANFVFFNPLPSWTSSFLDLFGIQESQIHVVGDRSLALDAVWVPSFYRDRELLFGDHLAQAWRHLKSSLLQAEPEQRSSWLNTLRSFVAGSKAPARAVPRIYLSRGKWGSNIANEEVLDATLKELGFQVLFPEEHSLAEQARYMDQAEIVVGEDGSAMHNVVFCRPTAASVTVSCRFAARRPLAFRPSRYQKLISDTASPLGYFYDPRIVGERVEVDARDFKAFMQKVIAEQETHAKSAS